MLVRIQEWLTQYKDPGYPDARAIRDYIDCEPEEHIKLLLAELIAIRNESFDQAQLLPVLGQRRLNEFDTYSEWARFMILTISQYRALGR